MAPTVQTQVLPRVGARPIIMTGMALGAVAMLAFFAQLTPSSTYVSHVLPGLLIMGIGMPCIFAPSFGTATLGVDRYEAGVASAMVNTSQQVGGAVGTAVLSTIFATAASSYASSHARSPGLARVRRGARLYDSVLLRRDLVSRSVPRRCARAASPHRAAAAAGEPVAEIALVHSGARAYLGVSSFEGAERPPGTRLPCAERSARLRRVGCLLALLALISPRLVLFVLWIFSDVLRRAFDGWIIPLLGFFLLPWTTLSYAAFWDWGSGRHVAGPVVLRRPGLS